MDERQRSIDRVRTLFPALAAFDAEDASGAGSEETEDPHSILYGEGRRWKLLLRELARGLAVVKRQGFSAATAHDFLLRRLHAYYFGDLRDGGRRTVPMYRGRPSDFEADMRRWEQSCLDVERTYQYLSRWLPEELNGRRMTEVLERGHVAETDDPLELIRLAGSPNRKTRHFARSKLVMAQFSMEQRRHGYDPSALQSERRDLESFLDRVLFQEPEGDAVWLIAELDPKDRYRCIAYHILTDENAPPESSASRYQVRLERRWIRVAGRSDPVPVFFFHRVKEHIILKALTKDERFLELLDLGDAIAMMFVMDREEMDAVTPAIRRVLVPCPGQVCNQGSSVGFRMGNGRLDPANPHSSQTYEAQKYNALVCDRVVEVQFVPVSAWVNARTMVGEVNHLYYKLRKHLNDVFPVLFPRGLFGVDWSDVQVQGMCQAHVRRRVAPES